MRIFLFIFLFSINAFGQDCSKLDVNLYGDVILKTKEKSFFNEFPKVWNVNSDRFTSLYIQKEERTSVDTVEIELSSKKFNKKYVKKVSQKGNSKNLYRIEELKFQEDIIPSYRLLPIKMKIKLTNQKEKICEENFRLEVIL